MENNNKAKARCHEAASDEAEVDRLSKLPDHVLLNILERVRTIDALRTCILSKRMLKLPPMLSLLDIDIGSLARYIKPNVDTIDRIFQYNIAVAAHRQGPECEESRDPHPQAEGQVLFEA